MSEQAPSGEGMLSTEERATFERDGYLVIDSLDLPSSVLDGIAGDLEGLYEGEGEERDGVIYTWHRIVNAWRISENVKAVALASKVVGLLGELYGRKPLPFQTINFRLPSQQRPHSDAIHFGTMPPGFMCGVWVAREDMDMGNGPLVYYPGSQRLPMITMQDAGAGAERSEYLTYELYIEQLIEREELEPRYGTVRKGEAIVWSANLLHGGTKKPDANRTRHSQVTHYYFEGCRYYAPMLSADDDVQWGDPRWIE